MKRIQMNNFGVVKEATIDFDSQVNIIIGPQASGKSTISKVIFFASLLGEWFMNACCDYTDSDEQDSKYKIFEKLIRKKFRDIFGDFKLLGEFEVCVEFDEQNGLRIYNAGVYIGIDFQKDTYSDLLDVTYKMEKYYEEVERQNLKILEFRKSAFKQRSEALMYFSELCPKYLSIDDSLYIPAGRSILTSFSRKTILDSIAGVDLTTESFLQQINSIKGVFENGIVGFVEEVKATGNLTPEKEHALNGALDIINKVLRAEYIYSDNGECLRINDKTQIAIRNASSGQQEILWPLILMLVQILGNLFPVIIVEEPEAHLYPEAQLQIMKLISLVANETDCKVIITTHSPYILSSANLLIQSGNVENVIEETLEDCVIEKQYRFSKKMVNAQKIDIINSFEMKRIIDEDTGLIDAYEIDTVSERINDVSEKLLELEIKYGL